VAEQLGDGAIGEAHRAGSGDRHEVGQRDPGLG
jgi:hypothetical protein